MTTKPKTQSSENHEVLIQLRDSMEGVVTRLDKFSAQQEMENKTIHARIDATQEKFMTSFTLLKDSLAERGRITPALIATIISSVAILAGAGSAYVSSQLVPLRESIKLSDDRHLTGETKRVLLEERLQSTAVAYAVADARSETDRAWSVKLLDEVRKLNTIPQ